MKLYLDIQSNLDIRSLNYNGNLDIKGGFLYHGLRMWCDYLRCLYSFLKLEVDLRFKFDLREVLGIKDILKETKSTLKLRFDCIH